MDNQNDSVILEAVQGELLAAATTNEPSRGESNLVEDKEVKEYVCHPSVFQRGFHRAPDIHEIRENGESVRVERFTVRTVEVWGRSRSVDFIFLDYVRASRFLSHISSCCL